MKFFLSLTALLFLTPSMSAAEIVIQNTGTISSKTTSSASTGGNVVEEGGSVTTGNASASSKSEVTSGSDGGNVHIETSTTVNGETKTQVVDKTLNKGEPVSVEVNSQAVAGQKPESSVKINGVEQNGSGVATVTEETVTRTDFPRVSVLTRVKSVVHSILSFFKFW